MKMTSSTIRGASILFLLFAAGCTGEAVGEAPLQAESKRASGGDRSSDDHPAKVAALITKAPPIVEKLIAMVNNPADIDGATRALSVPPRLLNYHLATQVDLTSIGLGKTTYLPVQIAEREGGRKSLYYLSAGEEALAGLYIGEQGVMLRHVHRLSGESVPARTGDTYAERITTQDGEELFTGQGRLDVLDAKKGIGKVLLTHTLRGEPLPAPEASVWILWSCIKVEW